MSRRPSRKEIYDHQSPSTAVTSVLQSLLYLAAFLCSKEIFQLLQMTGAKVFSKIPQSLPYFTSTCQNEFRHPVKRRAIIQIEYHSFRGYLQSLSTVKESSRHTTQHEGNDERVPVFG